MKKSLLIGKLIIRLDETFKLVHVCQLTRCLIPINIINKKNINHFKTNNLNKQEFTCTSNLKFLSTQLGAATKPKVLNDEFLNDNRNENEKNRLASENENASSAVPVSSTQAIENQKKNNKNESNIINLTNDTTRKEIGFEPSTLLDTDWKEIRVDYKQLLSYYSKLSKRNLTALVVCTTMMGCAMAPVPFDPYIFFYATLGTTLTSSSANAFNQFLEVPYDSQMNRTKDRVLVRGHLTPLHAFTFATLTGITGVAGLYFLVNPLTAALGTTTLILYTLIYTPMKRLSTLNTWVGSVVGAIPPLMGYTAMTGDIGAAGILMAAILYSWQFPHFHSLSWNLRAEYSRAGYRMISILNPRICTSSALSHSVALLVMCSYLAPMLQLTTWNFAIDSLPFNLYFIYLAFQFKRNADAQSSRKLFRYSLIYLPMVILLMLITKYPIESTPHNLDELKSRELEKDLQLITDRIRHLKKNVNTEKIN